MTSARSTASWSTQSGRRSGSWRSPRAASWASGRPSPWSPVEAITRVADDEVYISHTREHVAGAPAYDPDLVKEDSSSYPSGLYPYYGYEGGAGSAVPMLVTYPYAAG